MFLSKLLKRTRTRAAMAIAGFSMLFGVGAGIASSVSSLQNEVVETNAYDNRLHIVGTDQFGGWNTSGAVQLDNVGGDNVGGKKGLGITKDNTEFKIAYIDGGNVQWSWDNYGSTAMDNKSYTFAEDSGGNIKIKYVGTYDIYLTNSYKVYLARTLTISFNAHSGTVSPSSKTVSQQYSGASGNTYGDLPTPTREGYNFDGWYTESSGGTKITSSSSTYSLTANQTLHAHWTAKTYTITFYQNDEVGGTTTRSKTHGVAYTIPAPADVGMSAHGGRHFVKWNTKSNGTGTDYAAGFEYTTNANLTLYLIQDWYTYQYSTDGGSSWNTMTKTGDTPDGYVGQFAPSADSLFEAGHTITFQRYYGSEDPVTIGSIGSWEGNNYDTSTNKIKYSFVGKIYLKVTSGGGNTVYVEGYTQRSIQVTHDGNSSMFYLYKDSDTDFHTTALVTVYPGDTIKGVYNDEEKGGQIIYNLTEKDGDGDFSTSPTITCNAPGVFTIHLRSTDGGYTFPRLHFVMDAAESATLFAQTFNSAIFTVCTGITGGAKAVSDLKAAWGTSASSGQYRYYNSLTTATKALITSEPPYGTDPISACIERYRWVCGKYGPNGTNDIPDFMGLNPPKPADAALFAGSRSNADSPLTMTLWIVLGAGLAGLAAIGTAYFVSKKKKYRA